MGNCWSKCFEEDATEEDPVDPKTPLLGSTIKSIASSGGTEQSSKNFNAIFANTPGENESPEPQPKPTRSQRNFPMPPTGRYSSPPRQPSRTNLVRASTEFFAPPPPSLAFTTPPPTPPPPQGRAVSTPPPLSLSSAQPPMPSLPSQVTLPPRALSEQISPRTSPPVHTTQPQISPSPPSPQTTHNSQTSPSLPPKAFARSPVLDSLPRSPSIPPLPQLDNQNTPASEDKQDKVVQTNNQNTTTSSYNVLPETNQINESIPQNINVANQPPTENQVTNEPIPEQGPPKEARKEKESDKEKEKEQQKEKEKYTTYLSKIITSKNADSTPQERISQAIQSLQVLCKEIGEIISVSDATDDLSAETTMKKRLDILTLKASKHTVQLCEVVDTLTHAEFSTKNSLTTIKKHETKRGKWEEEIREMTRRASSKIEQLVIECRNANIEQRKTNVKNYIGEIERFLEKITTSVTQLVELVLAQWETMQSAQAIIDATTRHSSVSGVDTVMRAAKVAVSVVQRLVDSLANELVMTSGTDLKKVLNKTFSLASPTESKEIDPATFFSSALHVCALQLFDAIDAIAQGHFDPGVQLELWNKAKAVRGAGFLLQLSITEKNRGLSDRCLSLSAASRVYSSSIVDLIDSAVSAVSMSLPKHRQEDTSTSKTSANEGESENVWQDEEKIGEIIALESTESTSLSSSSSQPSNPGSPPTISSSPSPSPSVPSVTLSPSLRSTVVSPPANTIVQPAPLAQETPENNGEVKIDEPDAASKILAASTNEEKGGDVEQENENKQDNKTTEEIDDKTPKEDVASLVTPSDADTSLSAQSEASDSSAQTPISAQSEASNSSAQTPTSAQPEESNSYAPTSVSAQSEVSESSAPTPISAPDIHAQEKPNLTASAKIDPLDISVTSKKLKAATLNGLILYLVLDKIDIQYMETIALTHRSFVESKPFFLKLVELYNVPENKGTQVMVIQSRVLAFIKKWISLQVQDFSEDLANTVAKWTEEIMHKDNHAKGVAKQILDILAQRSAERNATRKSFADDMENKMHKEITPIEFVLAMEPQDIALQLTIIDHSLFCAIRPHELLFQSWNKPHLRHRAPNVLSMISRTNNIALWVASSILWHPKLSDRAQVMTKLVMVAEQLRKLKNFNTMFAVLSGLQLSSVNRLKYTKEKIPKKCTQAFDSLVELMSTKKSFKAYREALATEIPPCVPYLGLCLTDLTFIEEGNPDYVFANPDSSKLKLINFKKREKLFKVISDIQQFQKWKYPVIQGTKNSILEELPRNEEEQLYGMSLLREPRNASREQIV